MPSTRGIAAANRGKAHLTPIRSTTCFSRRGIWTRWALKIQFTSEISRFYWDAYQNQTDGSRAQHDLDEIVDINGRLQSLRDAITETRTMYTSRVGAGKPTLLARQRFGSL